MNEKGEAEKKDNLKGSLFSGLVSAVLLGVIAVSLVCISMLSFKAYSLAEESYQLAKSIHDEEKEERIKAEEEKKRISDYEIQQTMYEVYHKDELNIRDAKKTTYNHALLGSLIAEACDNTEWSHIECTIAGYEVVKAKGTFERPRSFAGNLIYNVNHSESDDITIWMLKRLDLDKITRIDFDMTFKKRLGEEFKTEYDHYLLDSVNLEIYKEGETEPTSYYIEEINLFVDSLLNYVARM